MSLKHKNYFDYWADVNPRLNSYLTANTNIKFIKALTDSIAFYSYISEDIGKKITRNKDISPKLDLFLVFALDQLRAALPLYTNLNLGPSAICTRATFENLVTIRFIVKDSYPSLYADRYNRFKDITKLKAHKSSTFLRKLSPQDEQSILAANPEWVDSTTGKLFKKTHWSAIYGMNFEQLVGRTNLKDYYSIYRTTSQFMHANSITVNMYSLNGGIRVMGSESHVRKFASLTALFALETIKDYSDFFGVNVDAETYHGIIKPLHDLVTET
ncbi:MAG: DUF5677 domain-containing protein [Pseudobdellovibrio sp.]